MSGSDKSQVVVVGAGPVGLALAIELGSRGVDVMVVEQRSRAGAQPRAKTTNVRSMTHMRRWGIADALREAAPLPYDHPTDIVFATKLFGHTLTVIENAFEGAKVRDPRFPEPAQWVPQYTVEKVLHQKIAQLPTVKMASATSFESLSQSTNCVTVRVRDLATNTNRTIEADYVIGADGARSQVRGSIGAKMIGDHAFGHNYNLIVRIPGLKASPPARRAIMYWLVNPESPGVLSPLDGADVFAFGTLLPPGVSAVPDGDVVSLVQAALGRAMDVEILERDLWAAHRLIADRYRNGRVFLAGDACHLHPPFGGYGMNLGIADGVDLGWKLAAVLAGWGGETLLASYEQERRPVHQRTIAEAVENYKTLSNHLLKAGLDDETEEGARARLEVAEEITAKKSREFKTLGVVLGSRYENSPIVVGDGSRPPAETRTDFQPSAHPGCLAPHAWLADGSSLYDHFSQGFTLLVLDATADEQADKIRRAAAAAHVPLKTVDLRDASLAQLYDAPLALIRPDQFVAWRGVEIAADSLIDAVRGVSATAFAKREASRASATARSEVPSENTRSSRA